MGLDKLEDPDSYNVLFSWGKRYPHHSDLSHLEYVKATLSVDGKEYCFMQVHDTTHAKFTYWESEKWARERLLLYIRRRLEHEAIHKN